MLLPESWMSVIGDENRESYFANLEDYLITERTNYEIYPSADRVFAALELTPFEKVCAVILGQDPYHDVGQAHGLAFSVLPGVKLPASLRNIFKELNADLGIPMPKHGCLIPWAKQGVLLLNTVLTVRAHEAHSHRGKGWETFTDAVIQKLSDRVEPLVFVLWGKPAQAKRKLINFERHVVLESAHPSPLSAYNGFFGSKPFSKINQQLCEWGQLEIDWRISSDVEVP